MIKTIKKLLDGKGENYILPFSGSMVRMKRPYASTCK